jgi:hypothetical protein
MFWLTHLEEAMRKQPKQSQIKNAIICLVIAASGFASISYPNPITQTMPYVVWICLEVKNNKDQ